MVLRMTTETGESRCGFGLCIHPPYTVMTYGPVQLIPVCRMHAHHFMRELGHAIETEQNDPEQGRAGYLSFCEAEGLDPDPWWGRR